MLCSVGCSLGNDSHCPKELTALRGLTPALERVKKCWQMGQFAKSHTGSKGFPRLSHPYHNHIDRSPFPSFAFRLQDALLVPNPLAAFSSSSDSVEGHGGECDCRISRGGGNWTCFSREGGMCCCCCRKQVSLCPEFEGSLVDGPGWACLWGCCFSFLKRSRKVSGRTGGTDPVGALQFYSPWVSLPADASSLRQRPVSADCVRV